MNIDAILLRNIALGRSWLDAIKTGLSIDDLAKREGLSRSRILPLVDLAFLSPTLVDAIIDGRQPAALTSSRLSKIGVPDAWSRQAALLVES